MSGPRTIVPPASFVPHGVAPIPGAPVPSLTNHGGPVLGNVEVVTIYWGASWANGNGSLSADVDQFFEFILTSSHMDMLAQYSTSATTIGRGRRVRSVGISNSEPGTATSTGREVTDAQIQQALQGWIAAGTVPATTANTLYFVYLPPNVVTIMTGGDRSCIAFCGYHNAVGSVYYAVVPYANCNGCVFPGKLLDTLTEVSSHELVEAITDPGLSAWWDSTTGNEIGDICNRQTRRLGGYMVQTEWSNTGSTCSLISAAGGAGNRISLWHVDAKGNQVNFMEHGPFAGWTALNCSNDNVLWRHDDGRLSFWVIDAQGNQVSFKEHGPFPGWTAVNCADGRILWRHDDGRISLWLVDAHGNQVYYKEHGPFAGWTALCCADNNVLWRHDDGRISFWVVDALGNQLSFKEHGPFPGWTALNYADGRILWRRGDGRISLWKVDAQGNQINFMEHGPFAGWTPLNCADNNVLWRHDDGRISFWVVDALGNQLSFKEHGPFPGWTAVNCADGKILWRR
jgi:hypothetical protein